MEAKDDFLLVVAAAVTPGVLLVSVTDMHASVIVAALKHAESIPPPPAATTAALTAVRNEAVIASVLPVVTRVSAAVLAVASVYSI